MSVSAFDHPWLAALVGDQDGTALFSADAELKAMLSVEAALAAAEAEVGLIPAAAGAAIEATCASFAPDLAALAAGAARDGVVVPELVRQLRAAVGEPHAGHVHHGATSQDIIDTALVLRLNELVPLFETRLAVARDALSALNADQGARTIAAVTRMQRARPMPATVRIAAWRAVVARAEETLGVQAARTCALQLGGPTGDRSGFGGKGDDVAANLAVRLGLADPGAAWHAERSRLVEFGDWASRLSGGLGKMGADVALMALTGAARLATGGGSSSMPHKTNPVGAETLVALAEFTAAQTAALHRSLVHEQERSGAAWTLEWMVLPPLLVATLAALRHAADLASNIEIVPMEDAGNG